MTLAERLDALLTRPIYECDLETIREAAKRLRALETGSGAMTDIVERLREGDFGPTYGPSGIELEAADEITRLRSERAELIEALEAVVIGCGALCVLNTNGQASELIAALEKTLFPRPDIEGGE